ncbi:MAG: response regulator [Deltaproteobacteria bacterium]|nr:response regulator [Deltaproteobacteria bacterium]
MTEKVLIVDDEKGFLDVLAERMQSRGMEVTTATSAKEALQKLEVETFDAIVLDLMMPEMGGIEALQRIKEKNPDSEVILLTGQPSVSKGVEAMKLGASDFLIKPADINELTEKIKLAKAHRMILVEKKTAKKMKDILRTKGW